jgi:hypothetical protein
LELALWSISHGFGKQSAADGGPAGEEGEDGGALASLPRVQCAAGRSGDSEFASGEVSVRFSSQMGTHFARAREVFLGFGREVLNPKP